MKNLSIIIALCILQLFSNDTYAYDRVLVWKVVPGTSAYISTNTPYKLFCETNGSYLDYYSRSRGIDLAFNYRLNYRNIKFVKAGNGTGPIRYGDRVAIYVERGGYLYYCRRTYGINLAYSSTPVYQWEIRNNSYLNSGNQSHEMVPGSATIALYNSYNRGYLIYGVRQWGPNLKWATTAPPPTTTTAQITGNVRNGPFPVSSTSGRCTGPVSWTFTPVRLTGSAGRDDQFVISKRYEGFETNAGPSEWWCTFTENFIIIKSGTWKVRVQTPLWFTECEVTFNNGINSINFTMNKPGCRTGLQYP
jgi:hypothetical protein